MKPHVKIYLTFFGYGIEDFIPCEICARRAVDVHHIDARGMGGTSEKDDIKNLMGLCREGHLKFGDKKEFKESLIIIHTDFIDGKTNQKLLSCSSPDGSDINSGTATNRNSNYNFK